MLSTVACFEMNYIVFVKWREHRVLCLPRVSCLKQGEGLARLHRTPKVLRVFIVRIAYFGACTAQVLAAVGVAVQRSD